MNINRLFDLSGKTAIVTGGGNGIGKSCCEILSEAGANVIVSDLNEEQARETADRIKQKGGEAIAVGCDVSQDQDRTHLVEKAVEAFGSIHILVNNVGIGGGRDENPEKVTLEYFKKIFDVNLFSLWRMCQLCVPVMKKSGYGSIVNISSMSSINKSPGINAYASSKAAINHLTANLAMDFGPEVRINAVGPGAVETHALSTVMTPQIKEKMLSHTPLKRLGRPEDIARVVLFFASPASEWISGQTLFVNGGGTQTLD